MCAGTARQTDTGCPQKLNGNTPAAPEHKHLFTAGLQLVMPDGIPATAEAEPVLWVKNSPTPGASTICTEMYLNGAGTFSEITQADLNQIHRAQIRKTDVYTAADAGALNLIRPALLTGLGINHPSESISLDSGLFCQILHCKDNTTFIFYWFNSRARVKEQRYELEVVVSIANCPCSLFSIFQYYNKNLSILI